MTTKAEKIGAALAKAVKATTGITSAQLGAAMYRTNIKSVPSPFSSRSGPRSRASAPMASPAR